MNISDKNIPLTDRIEHIKTLAKEEQLKLVHGARFEDEILSVLYTNGDEDVKKDIAVYRWLSMDFVKKHNVLEYLYSLYSTNPPPSITFKKYIQYAIDLVEEKDKIDSSIDNCIPIYSCTIERY